MEEVLDFLEESQKNGNPRNREFLLKTMLKISPVSVIITNPQGIIEFVNQKSEITSGYRAKELIGQDPKVLRSPLNKISYQGLWDKLKSGITWHGEFLNRSKNGHDYWERASITPIHDIDGNIQHLLAIKEDITENKNLINALTASEKKYQLLFESMQSACAWYKIICNEQGNPIDYTFLGVNKAFEIQTGLNRKNIINKNASEVIPNMNPQWLKQYYQAANKGENIRFEGYSDNLQKWFDIQAFQIAPGEFGSIFLDITENKNVQKQNDKLAQEQESRVRQLQLLYWLASVGSRKDVSLTNFLEDAIHTVILFFSEFRDIRVHFTWRIHNLGKSAPGEWPVIFSNNFDIDGDAADISISSHPDDSHQLSHAEIKILEMFFHELKHTSELKIQEKRLEDQQEQIFQASKLVSLGELTSGIAHEVNNPTNYILLNTEILEDLFEELQTIFANDEDSPLNSIHSERGRSIVDIKSDMERFLKTLKEGGLRIREIVKSLKDYSRLEPSLDRHPVSIYEIVHNSATILQNPIKKSTQNFKINLSKDTPKVIGQFHQLEQVIINILNNACRSLPSREKGIYISSRVIEHKNELELEVLDEGVGIPQENISKLTDPFFTTYRTEGGTGLGLSISQKIIQDHDGRIKFESEVGKGTTVRIRLPIAKENI